MDEYDLEHELTVLDEEIGNLAKRLHTAPAIVGRDLRAALGYRAELIAIKREAVAAQTIAEWRQESRQLFDNGFENAATLLDAVEDALDAEEAEK